MHRLCFLFLIVITIVLYKQKELCTGAFLLNTIRKGRRAFCPLVKSNTLINGTEIKSIKRNEFHDRCVITVKGGDGGNGACSFMSFSQKKGKKYASGGKGGKGGDVYLIGDKTIDNFFNLKLKCFYHAQKGENGSSNNKNGENGKDEYLKVPINTIVYNEEKKFINFIFRNNQKVLIAKGGNGGKGNYSFRTKFLKIPFVCQLGEKRKEKKIYLKKVFFCDFCIIGYPNVGKSTLLHRITNANVKIANYSFTSKFPNVAVFKDTDGEVDLLEETEETNAHKNEKEKEEEGEDGKDEENVKKDAENEKENAKKDAENEKDDENEKEDENENDEENAKKNTEINTEVDQSNMFITSEESGESEVDEMIRHKRKKRYVVIDFPGIIENLNEKKKNIAYKYLEHLKHSKILTYIFDINSGDIVYQYNTLKNVLVNYDESFKRKKEIILLNKMDIYNGIIKINGQEHTVCKNNLQNVLSQIKTITKVEHIFCISALTGENVDVAMEAIITNIDNKDTVNDFLKTLPPFMDIEKIENSNYFNPKDFQIYKFNKNIFFIKGKYIENQANIFDFSKDDTLRIFRKILIDLNIDKKLRDMGATDEHKIVIGNFAFDFSDDY